MYRAKKDVQLGYKILKKGDWGGEYTFKRHNS